MAEDPQRGALEGAADALLAERAADGDVRAFTVLVRRHAPAVHAFAARMLGGTADADDVVQDTFLTAWARLGDLREPDRLRGWLLRIAARTALDRVRRRREAVLDADAVPAPAAAGPVRIAEQRAALDALAAALLALPEAQRHAWLLRETAGCTYEEIAEELQVPVSTVRGLLARARATLLQRMEGWR